MDVFENSENKQCDINLEDYPFICRICLRRGDLRLIEDEDYLLDLFVTITKIDVRSTASLPENICNNCVKTLEDISLFIEVSKYNDAKSEKNFLPNNENEHVDPAECGTSQKNIIKSEETIDDNKEDLQYFNRFEICQICYSTNILKPVEGKAHLMQVFQNITNIHVKAEGISNRNNICNKCINELESISSFISVSLYNEIKLKYTIVRNEALETENCLEGNSVDMAYHNEVKKDVDFDENAHSYENKTFHTFIDIKEEIIDTPEASIDQINQNGITNFSESPSEEHPFDCGPCKDEFSAGTHLKKQLGLDIKLEIPSETNHLFISSGERTFECHCCNITFSQKSDLKTHMRTHSEAKPFKCDSCEKHFSQKSNLQQHKLIHSGEKPFKCDCCEKSVSDKSNLQRHMRIHTGEKPFKCDCCEKTFSDRSSLRRHMRTHTGEKPFKCNCCEKCFSFKTGLQRHMHSHTEENPFKCDCCEKSFSDKSSLQRHVRSHTGEKPFKCDCCDKSFSDKSSLQRHMRTRTGEKPIKCDCCEKSFSGKSSLQRHLLTQH